MKKIIVILGMHRSGTSLLSRAMKVFGAEHGDNLVAANEISNVKGHWEDNDVMNLNERMLAHLSKTWDTIAPITDEDIKSLLEAPFYQEAMDLM